jgi:hypothetical protein
VARVLVNRVRLERTRQFGGCFLGWELWKRLGLDGFFEQALDEEGAEVPWSRVAAVLAINRLCAPGSELAIEQRWYPSTALDDLLEIEEGKINDSRVCRRGGRKEPDDEPGVLARSSSGLRTDGDRIDREPGGISV